ncbi:NlpC/P60 family protein [Halomonas sp. PAMB 3232]|uniref:C40 family peptidase n=1 Tax=Halomonas sp. PAMB 3232 TaxID=3075221 RepID=UPI00289C4079|nr:NlpC/P60 family protein [Halomonas sp. PAMB 3232]WNL37982.1 NlpC/P60 family protein [Halomonas sp. PAMB 3232]
MVSLPHWSVTAARVVGACVIFSLLAGCAGSQSRHGVEPPDDYFAMSLPGLKNGQNAQMSPVDNPLNSLSSVQTPPPMMIKNALLAQHERWSGTPYRIGGTTQRGVDCSGFVRNIYRDAFNRDLPRSTTDQVHEGRLIDRQELQAGDLVFFRPPGPYNHVGIYMGDGYFMHASSSQGVIISSMQNSYWQRYYWQSRRALEPTHLASLGGF